MLKPAALRSCLTAIVLLTTSVTAAIAQSDRAALVEKLDSLAGSGVLENRAVGIAAAVVRGNDTLLLKGYGKADVEWNVPMPADAVFEIGSITKQFTAVASPSAATCGWCSCTTGVASCTERLAAARR